MSVDVTGRLLLPARREGRAVELLRERVGELRWLPEPPELTVRQELGVFLNAECRREGDWLDLTPDRQGDPTWSHDATRAYLWLSHLVDVGEVHVLGGEDGDWRYVYAPDRFTQVGRNGWDLAPIPTAADWDPGLPPEWEAEEREAALEGERRAAGRARRSPFLRRLLGG